LKQVPADAIKIDQRYLNGLPENQTNANFSNAIISMAHELKLFVIADGVKNDLQLAHLKKHECDYAQGSVFIEAMRFDKLLEYLASPHSTSKKASLN
jgi:EAL domain-containing protein (putative c-di-GMP-specific phosphodiesterase class I)